MQAFKAPLGRRINSRSYASNLVSRAQVFLAKFKCSSLSESVWDVNIGGSVDIDTNFRTHGTSRFDDEVVIQGASKDFIMKNGSGTAKITAGSTSGNITGNLSVSNDLGLNMNGDLELLDNNSDIILKSLNLYGEDSKLRVNGVWERN